MLIVAALLVLFIALVHSVLGERYILRRLFRRDNLPKLFGGTDFTKRTLRFAWHITSVAWCGLGALLWLLAQPAAPTSRDVAGVVSLTFGASALLALGGSRGRHLAWVVFLAIAVLAWWGTR